MKEQQLGEAAPQRGNKITRWLGRATLALLGWQIVGQVPNLPKFVAIGAPHTSNWDFPLGMLLFIALGLRVSWMGKDSFVNGPGKRIWHWMGGIPINRRAAHGVVDQMIDAFKNRDKFVLGITPEGTRSKVEKWKTGFYHIAQGASVPIFPIEINFKIKQFVLHPAFMPSGELAVDLPILQALYAQSQGKRPELQ
ncbi:MAG: lysophospholipid acyltransferase family protein [Ardenticatenaceae bacterium]|nr:lysophospholipid acyltransferase family protein [Ardenticatenaceae bacterium]MCB9445760.1 lysophospholipid acyltransferase family protein [Ardenticatenaceae bacterium]